MNLCSTHTTISLLAENKPLGTRFSVRARPTKVAHVLKELGEATGQDVQLVCRERVSKAQRVTHPRVLFTWNVRESEHALAAALGDARKLAEMKWHGPNFEVPFNLWPHRVTMTEQDARSELAALAAVLERARSALDSETYAA